MMNYECGTAPRSEQHLAQGLNVQIVVSFNFYILKLNCLRKRVVTPPSQDYGKDELLMCRGPIYHNIARNMKTLLQGRKSLG